METNTITISAESLRLKHACKAADDYAHLTGVFFRGGYAFGTNGKILAIRATTVEEPSYMVIELPKAAKKVRELTFRKLDQVLVSIDASATAAILDHPAPPVGEVFRELVGKAMNPVRITINARLLMDLAKAIGADTDINCPVTIEIDPSSPRNGMLVATHCSSTVGILMPMTAHESGAVIPSDILAPILAVL